MQKLAGMTDLRESTENAGEHARRWSSLVRGQLPPQQRYHERRKPRGFGDSIDFSFVKIFILSHNYM